jgi:hypothetical protein
MAYWDRVLIKEVINKALQDAVDKHEKKTEINQYLKSNEYNNRGY